MYKLGFPENSAVFIAFCSSNLTGLLNSISEPLMKEFEFTTFNLLMQCLNAYITLPNLMIVGSLQCSPCSLIISGSEWGEALLFWLGKQSSSFSMLSIQIQQQTKLHDMNFLSDAGKQNPVADVVSRGNSLWENHTFCSLACLWDNEIWICFCSSHHQTQLP